jgi:hypothetical protein
MNWALSRPPRSRRRRALAGEQKHARTRSPVTLEAIAPAVLEGYGLKPVHDPGHLEVAQ